MKGKKLEIALIALMILYTARFWTFKTLSHHPYSLTPITLPRVWLREKVGLDITLINEVFRAELNREIAPAVAEVDFRGECYTIDYAAHFTQTPQPIGLLYEGKGNSPDGRGISLELYISDRDLSSVMPLSKMITWLGPERQLGWLGSTAAILDYQQAGQTVRGQFHVKHDDCFYLGELRYHDPAMNGDWEHDQKIWETALDQLLPFLAE